MGIIAAADLSGHTVTHARSAIPAWGISYHDVSVDGNVILSGAVTLTVADLVIKGTILSGGPGGSGRSFFRVVAGAGGWGKPLPKKSYANDAGVKLITVLVDAAAVAGETLDLTTIDPQARIGPYYAWVAGDPASRVLEQLVPGAWYVGEDGITRLGARPATTLTADATRTTQADLAAGTLTLASETIATILPGIVVDGLAAVDVEHTIDSKNGLRSKIWGSLAGSTSRRLAAWKKLFEQLDPLRKFRGVSEYRVVTQDGQRLNLQPVRVSTGMPDLGRVMVRPGAPGVSASHHLGARVLVGFADSSPSQPFVFAFEDAEGGGFSPQSLAISAGGYEATEHLTTAEAVVNLLSNLLITIGAASSPGGASGAAALATALFALTTPATAQAFFTAAVTAAGVPLTGTLTPTMASAIASALAAKTSDGTGLVPSVGCPALKSG